MSHFLFYDPETGAAAYWQGEGPVQRGTLEELRAPPAPVTVLLGGVVLAQVEVPARQRQRIVQAVPYALEESLCEDIEAFHFAVGKRTADGRVAVAIVRHKTLRRVLDELRAAGWGPARMLPEILAVPRPETGWGVLALPRRVLVRTAAQQGFSVDRESLADWLPLALAEYGTPPRADLYGEDLGALALLFGESEVREFPGDESVLRVDDSLDLCQGEYAPRSLSAELWRPWRLSAALAALWLLLQGALLGHQVWTLRQQEQDLRRHMTDLYREVFPDARHIVNPRVQMEQRLGELRNAATPLAGDVFLRHFQALAEALAPVQGQSLQRLDYRDQGFDLQLTLPDLQSLENLKQQLAGRGLTVEIRAAEGRRNTVEARLRVTPS